MPPREWPCESGAVDPVRSGLACRPRELRVAAATAEGPGPQTVTGL